MVKKIWKKNGENKKTKHKYEMKLNLQARKMISTINITNL